MFEKKKKKKLLENINPKENKSNSLKFSIANVRNANKRKNLWRKIHFRITKMLAKKLIFWSKSIKEKVIIIK